MSVARSARDRCQAVAWRRQDPRSCSDSRLQTSKLKCAALMTRALVVLRVACALLVLAAGNVNSLPKAQPSGPRIALLFMTQGPMPLEENWKRFFEGVQGLHPPQLAPAQLAQLLQKHAINQLDHQLRVAGVMQHSNAVRKAPCISNQVLMVRAPAGTLAECESGAAAVSACIHLAWCLS